MLQNHFMATVSPRAPLWSSLGCSPSQGVKSLLDQWDMSTCTPPSIPLSRYKDSGTLCSKRSDSATRATQVCSPPTSPVCTLVGCREVKEQLFEGVMLTEFEHVDWSVHMHVWVLIVGKSWRWDDKRAGHRPAQLPNPLSSGTKFLGVKNSNLNPAFQAIMPVYLAR